MYRADISDIDKPLPRTFYDRDPVQVARELIGKAIVRELDGERIAGIILETEAYLAEGDPASHSHRGINRKNQSMFGEPGHLYVYSIHAKYCLNAVTERQGRGSAVLIRALEPAQGIETMSRLRGASAPRDLCRGPARLCQALHVTREQDGTDLTTQSQVWITSAKLNQTLTIASSPRIGISDARELALRFFVNRHPLVSGRARDHSDRPLRDYRLLTGEGLE